MEITIDDHAPTGGQGEVERYDELKLETDEIARLVIPVPTATAEYVHELKPILIVNGVIQMEPKQRKDKSTYEVPARGFKGRKICTGIAEYPNPEDPAHPLPGPLKVKGLDPENCIMCAAAASGIADLKPELRYAIPVIRITTTNKKTTDIQDPVNAKIYVLPLTWRQYGDLSTNLKGIRELYGYGPEVPVSPTMADVVIECEDGGFKRYNFLTPMRPHWRAEPGSPKNTPARNPALQQLIVGLWKNPANRPTPEQLTASCGKSGDSVFVQQDLDEVIEAHQLAKAIEKREKMGGVPEPAAATAQAGGAADLDGGLDEIDSILGTDEPAAPAVPAQDAAAPADPDLAGLDEFAAATTSSPANGNGQPAPAAPAEPEAVPAAAAPAAPAESFDEVWDKL